jgi:hypothetical protein
VSPCSCASCWQAVCVSGAAAVLACLCTLCLRLEPCYRACVTRLLFRAPPSRHSPDALQPRLRCVDGLAGRGLSAHAERQSYTGRPACPCLPCGRPPGGVKSRGLGAAAAVPGAAASPSPARVVDRQSALLQAVLELLKDVVCLPRVQMQFTSTSGGLRGDPTPAFSSDEHVHLRSSFGSRYGSSA